MNTTSTPKKGPKMIKTPTLTPLLTVGVLVAALAFAATPALAAETCPNEQLRAEDHSTELPDCRAYELVSPPSTNGEPLGDEQVSADGSRVSFESLGDFGEAGLGESAQGELYVSSRGVSGWSTVSAMPPASEFQKEAPLHVFFSRWVSGEMTEWLWMAAPDSASPIDMRIYRRRPGGEPVEAGPTASPEELRLWTPAEGGPPVRFAGATPDLSHILFSPEKETLDENLHLFWPGDPTTGHASLYEYVGTGNTEPFMVDVSPGPREAEDRPAEDPTVISKCGADLGGGTTPDVSSFSDDNYNAISSVPSTEEGRMVFFTVFGTAFGTSTLCTGGGSPAVDELYARVGGSRTVAISEPSREDCEACDTSMEAQEAAPAGAQFQGANQEGSEVFFLTKQRLFDGARGEGPAGTENLYEYDFDAEAEHERVSLVAPEMAGVMRVSEDGSHVYFVSQAVLAGTTANEYGVGPAAGAENLYVEDTVTHVATFIATLSPSDSQEWSPEDSRGSMDATPEGRFLVFASVREHVTPDASGGGRQLYRYDSEQSAEEESLHVPRLVRVTVGDPESNDGNDGANFAVDEDSYIDVVSPQPGAVSVSLGGAVFFEGKAGLTPQALNFAPIGVFEEEERYALNVYEYENGHVYLISDGRDTHAIFSTTAVGLAGISPSGSDVYFKSADSLVGQAGPEIGVPRIYDARVDGGFPAPVPPVACAGEACQPPASEPPAFAAPASAVFSGTGNLAAPPAVVTPKPTTKTVKCKKGETKNKKGKCVPKKKKKTKKSNHGKGSK